MSAASYEKFMLALGAPGTGKSTQVMRLMINFVKRGGRVLILMADDSEYQTVDYVDFEDPQAIRSFKGIKKTIFDTEYTTSKIVNHLTHCMIVMEDCMSYYGNAIPIDLRRMLIRRRHYHLNTIAVGHGFTEMPPKFFTFATDIMLFQTLDNIKKRKDDIKNYYVMEAAKRRIDQKAQHDKYYFEIIPQ